MGQLFQLCKPINQAVSGRRSIQLHFSNIIAGSILARGNLHYYRGPVRFVRKPHHHRCPQENRDQYYLQQIADDTR